MSLTLLSMSFFPTAESRAWSRASTRPSHSRSLLRASAPSELTFLHKHTQLFYKMQHQHQREHTHVELLHSLNKISIIIVIVIFIITQTHKLWSINKFLFPWQHMDRIRTRGNYTVFLCEYTKTMSVLWSKHTYCI